MDDIAVKTAKELILKGDIEVIIGYEKGKAPFQSVPFFARTTEDCEKLVLNPFCFHNLVSYIENFQGKVALFAKPCDAKAIIGLLQENQIKREKVHIIGINCQGIVNPKKLLKALNGKKVKEWKVKGEKIEIQCEGKTEEFLLKDFIMNKCISCDNRTPNIFDQVIGDEVKIEKISEDYKRVKELENLPLEERQKYWNEHFDKCIRCYACVKTCPLCYCERCFVEISTPQWLGKSNELKNNKSFHIIRAFHLAGRCIGCGECERACPMDIPLGELNTKMKKSVQENFDYIPGTKWDVPPPLSTFKKEDPQDFIH